MNSEEKAKALEDLDDLIEDGEKTIEWVSAEYSDVLAQNLDNRLPHILDRQNQLAEILKKVLTESM